MRTGSSSWPSPGSSRVGRRSRTTQRRCWRSRRCSTRSGLDRQSFVAIVGGGALLDAAGYAAATAHRGIRTVRLPTTVLAQADSGVGVKNGVNAFGVKNFLGTFVPPFAVLNDRRFLESLGRRDTLAGMAEAGQGRADPRPGVPRLAGSARRRAGRLRPEAVSELIRRAAASPEHIATSGDPFEMGARGRSTSGTGPPTSSRRSRANRLRHGRRWPSASRSTRCYSLAAGLLPAAAVERVLGLLGRLGAAALGRGARSRGSRRPARASWTASRSSGSTWAASSPSRCWPRSAGASRCTRCARRSRGWRPGRAAPRATADREARRSGRACISPTARTSIPARAGPRCARTSSATWRGQGGRGADPALRRRPAALGGGGGRTLARPAELRGVPCLPARQRLLRLHDQRLSVRAVSRDAREGGGLPPRLARRRAARRTAIAWPTCSPRFSQRSPDGGTVSTVPGAFRSASGTRPTRREWRT